jgi:hypothetical protein
MQPLDADNPGQSANSSIKPMRLQRSCRCVSIRVHLWLLCPCANLTALGKHLPQVQRLEINRSYIKPVGGSHLAAVNAVASGPGAANIGFQAFCRAPAVAYFSTGQRRLVVSLHHYLRDDRASLITEVQECPVWVVAYLPNLMFTVVETSVLIKPAPSTE